MGRNASAFLPSLLVFLLTLSLAAAQEDFSASSQASYTLCPCSGQGYPVIIANTGSLSSTYTLSVNKDVEDWVTLSPQTFSLNPGQTARVVVYVTSPCQQQQAAPISLLINTENGLAKAIVTTIQFSSCYGFSLTQGEPVETPGAAITFKPHAGSYPVCLHDTTTIPILVKNLDTAFDNAYSFSAEGPARLHVSSFGLRKGSSAVLLADVSPETEEDADVILTAISEKGQLSAQMKLSIDANTCYGLKTEIEPEIVDICGGDSQQVSFRVSNEGLYRENISLLLEGAGWATLHGDEFSLGANRFTSRSMTISPPADERGKHPLTVKAVLASTPSVSSEDLFVVDVEPRNTCYASSIEAKGKIIAGEEYLPIAVKNTGSKQQTFSLWVENIDWGELSESSIELNPGQEHHATLHLVPHENVTRGKYAVVVGIASPYQSLKKEIAVNYAPDTTATKAIKNIFYLYRYYLYVAVLLLIVLFLFRTPLSKAYQRHRKQAERRKARMEALKAAKVTREQKLTKESAEEEPGPWTPYTWGSAALVALAALAGIGIALFPAYVRAFVLSYGWQIVAIIIIAFIVWLVLPKIMRKRRRRKK
jgi:hypothetical protein